jgi:hypothetical protein
MLGQPSEPAATEDGESDSEAESVESVVKHFDEHGFPSGSILAGTAAAQVAEAMRKAGHAVKPPTHTRFDEDYTPVQADQVPLPPSGSDNSESENDSGSDNESDSDGGPEVASSRAPEPEGGAKLLGSDGSFVSEDSDSQSESDEPESESDNDSGSESDSDRDNDDDNDHGSDAGSVGGHTNASNDDSDDGDGSDGSDANSDNIVADSSASGSESGAADSSSDDDSSDDDSSDDDDSHDSVDEASSQPSAEKEATATKPRNSATQVPAPEETASHTKRDSTETPKSVPPGQGKSATQRRNARRRAALKAKNAAARGVDLPTVEHQPAANLEAHMQDIQESLAQKKAQLLEATSIGQRPGQLNNQEDSQDVPEQNGDVEDDPAGKDDLAGEDDPEAWRDKVIYRAVECCHDDMELSEPPFPFVQGWDPQQQELRGRRGGRSKRKQRNQPEFLDEEGRSAAKRRKYAGNSAGGDGDSFYSHGDAGVDDTTLNYDDEPNNYDNEPEGSSQKAEQAPEDVEEDLPPIPADVSALPTLEPGKARPGMILTWKQWLLSKATDWQPQVSSLTGIVVEVLDDSTVKVRLARRDRNVDRAEKTYDDEGNRVYDKFELPGMEDEGEEEAAEQGYRTLDLADMIEPRILQQPASQPVEAESQQQSTSSSIEGDTVHDGEPNPSNNRALPNPADNSALPNPSDNRAPSASDQGEAELESKAIGSPCADPDVSHGNQSIVSEAYGAQEPGDISISEDRRHEISGLINDAGFRRDVDPSVTSTVGLDLSSPSRQLEEETILEAAAFSEISQVESHATAKPTSQATSNNIDSQPIYLEPFRGFSGPISEPVEGRRVAYPKLDLPPSETDSLYSGRQVDPDFSIELGEDPIHEADDPAGESRSTLGRHSSDEQHPDEQHPSKMFIKQDSSSNSEAGSSVSSVQSLSDIWASMSTNRSHSPSKRDIELAIKARKSEVAPDPEYEAEMRRLDEADTSGYEENKFSQLAQELVEKPIEKPTPKKRRAQPQQQNGGLEPSPAPSRIKAERASPPARRIKVERATSSSRKAPFVVPEGSQVVSLLSSSPEPELEEHYAEDSVDETYTEPSSSLPDGSGWVQKNKKKEKRPGRGLGGKSLPPPSSAPAVVSRKAVSRESTVGGVGGGNKERGADDVKKRSISGSPAVREALLKARKKVFGNIL